MDAYEKLVRDAKLVGDAWVDTGSDSVYGGVYIVCGDDMRRFSGYGPAAAFTRERLEEIRQLRIEIEGAKDEFHTDDADFADWLREGAYLGTELPTEEQEPADHDTVVKWVRIWCRDQRTRNRLQSALAELTEGMKQEAINGR